MRRIFLSIASLILVETSALGAGTTPQRPRIVGISHAAFYVSDMAKARSFYEGFLVDASLDVTVEM